MKPLVQLMLTGVLALLAVTLLLSGRRTVHADAAPPPGAAASDVVPGQGTQVQMISETVVLDIRSEPLAESDYTRTIALVTADFLMRNLGSQTETLEVRFPMAWPTSWGWSPDIMIQNVEAAIGDRQVMTKQVDFDGQPWAVWTATFPPGKDVRLKVTYRTAATEWNNSLLGYFSTLHLDGNNSLAEFYYILETGAGWRGPIGQGDIIFRFPTTASLEMIEASDYFQPVYTSTTPSFVAEGRDLRWHFTNLEPTSKDNVSLSVITPPIWQAILDARRQTQLNPQDAAAQTRLGEAYWAAIPVKNTWPQEMSFAQHFGPLAEAAFKRAVELAPDSIPAHLSYARFLTYRAWSETPESYYNRAIQEVNHLLEMDPTNAEAKDLAAFLHDTIYTYYLVTPIPTDLSHGQNNQSDSVATELPSHPQMTTKPSVAGPNTTIVPTHRADIVSTRTAVTPTIPALVPPADSINSGTLLLLGGGIVVLVSAIAYLRLKR